MKTLAGGTPMKNTTPDGRQARQAWTTRQELGDLGEEREDLDEELDDALLDLVEPARVASASRPDEDSQSVHDTR